VNFLQLVQRLRQEGEGNGALITTVVNQTGEARRLVDWIQAAWLEIQGMSTTWGFMRSSFSFNTTAGVGYYTPTAAGVSGLASWHLDTIRIYRTSIGVADEQFLPYWSYPQFRDTYLYSSMRLNQGRPVVFSVRPQDTALLLGEVPEDIYTISGEYQESPAEMVVADTSTPTLPNHLHLMVVYKAMEYLGLYESAGEVAQRGQAQF
jgi:hypothetical protein